MAQGRVIFIRPFLYYEEVSSYAKAGSPTICGALPKSARFTLGFGVNSWAFSNYGICRKQWSDNNYNRYNRLCHCYK